MPNFKIRLKPDVKLVEQEDNTLVVQSPIMSFPMKNVNPGVRAVLTLLADSGASDPEIKATLASVDNGSGTFPFFTMFPRLMGLGFLSHMLEVDNQPFLSIVPVSPFYTFFKGNIEATDRYTLSRFVCIRPNNGAMILENPLAYGQLILHHTDVLGLLDLLNEPHSYPQMQEKYPKFDDDSAAKFFQLLLGAKAITRVDEQGHTEEQANPTLRQWDFHDLYFHTRSRFGRHANAFGGNYRFIGEIAPQPALKSQMSEETIDLYTPDLSQLHETDVPFTQVLESRKSTRSFEPLTVQQLGEFLYRSARVRTIFDVEAEHGGLVEKIQHTSRPYPSGGASYEFEIYVTVNQCDGLAQGLYHYDPQNHRLEKLSDRNAQTDNLLRDALASYNPTLTLDFPPVLINMAARFQRVSWKYDALAYTIILKNVGVLQQTMYLVATAMGIGACAIGGGNSDLFALAAKTDYLMETSVGEFILGNPKPE